MALTPTEALAQVQRVHDNQLALADPVSEAWLAQIAWMEAVTAALTALSSTAPAEPSTLQEQVTALSATLQSFQQKLAALFAPAPTTPPSEGDAA